MKAVLAFAPTLDLRVVAEEIEGANRFRQLQELDRRQGPGYYFATPPSALAIGQLFAPGVSRIDVAATVKSVLEA